MRRYYYPILEKMFVLNSTHKKVKQEALAEVLKLRLELLTLATNWGKLVAEVNKKGGQDFLNRGIIPGKSVPNSFTKEEFLQLIKFCHPDKHDGDPEANELTRKLLVMREKSGL